MTPLSLAASDRLAPARVSPSTGSAFPPSLTAERDGPATGCLLPRRGSVQRQQRGRRRFPRAALLQVDPLMAALLSYWTPHSGRCCR